MKIDGKNTKIFIAIAALIVIILIYLLFFSKHVTGIVLNKDLIKIYESYSEKLDARVVPDNVSAELVWESSNPSVASVNEEGVVLGIKSGIAKIIVSTTDGEISSSCIVSVVERKVKDLVFDVNEININVGENKQITATIKPDELKNEKINWSSSNPLVADVDNNGKVTGLEQGVSEIKAELYGAIKSILAYIGTKINSIKFTNNEIKIDKNKSLELEINVNPENSIKEEIIWESSDSDIVSVDKDGNITAKELGTATITATTMYSKIKDTCEVTVDKEKFEIVYMEANKTDIRVNGEKLGELPTVKKSGYGLLGWYTEKTGGKMVSENTIVESNMTLYPHWEKLYILPNDANKISGFKVTVSYDSDTLKYKILERGGEYYSLIWVDNAYEQFKSAIAYPNGIAFLKAEYILENEIKNKGYQNKGLVSVNASFTWYDRVASPFYVIDGKIIRDVENKKYPDNMHAILALTKEGKLTSYGFKNDDYAFNMNTRNQMINDGVRDVFAMTGGTDNNWQVVAHRTQICQVDLHNFVLTSGHGKVKDVGNRTKPFGCSLVYNLDGGGSRKLYYKTNTNNLVKLMGGSRPRPDMLYFVEK